MKDRPWYKRNPSHFLGGTNHMDIIQKGVYSVLLDVMYDKGGVIADDPHRLAGICGCSVRKFKTTRDWLIKDGKLVSDGATLTNSRVLKELQISRKEAEKLSENGRKGAEKTNEKKMNSLKNNDLGFCGPDEKGRHIRDKSIDIKEKNTKKENSDDFDTWWESVPRKVAKGQARKAYDTARKKTDAETLLAGIRAYAASDPDPKYTKHPATWLNGECWEDDIGAKPAGKTSASSDLGQWELRVASFRKSGFWFDEWGPSPDNPGCRAPRAILDREEVQNDFQN